MVLFHFNFLFQENGNGIIKSEIENGNGNRKYENIT